MTLFLEGDSGVGKSYLLREILAPYAPRIAGFSVQRLVENGEGVGYRAAVFRGEYPPAEMEYGNGGQEGVFLLRGRTNLSALEAAALEAERDAPGRRLVLLDEIGGVEMTSPVFMGALERILSGKTPVAGVFKSRKNLERMAQNLGLVGGCGDAHRKLEAVIRNSGELITVTKGNRGELGVYITERLVPLLGDV